MRGANRRQQRGVALITVLLVFALVAVIAAELMQRSQLSLRSVSGLVDNRQAYYYALAGESFARQLLAEDGLSNKIDTLLEDWAQTKDQKPFDIDNGEMHIEIHDLQGRFNLNNLIDAESGEAWVTRFRKLLAELQLNPNYASELKDWLDRDNAPSPNGGAEDGEYADYLTAGGAERDISALRLLRSMQPDDYAKLAPYVAVLPVEGQVESDAATATPINVNTADSVVLSSIMQAPQVAQAIVKQQSGGYPNKDVFGDPSVDVASSYFEVVVTVNYANRWQRVRTVLKRNIQSGSKVTFQVLSRVRSPLIEDSEE